VCKIEQGCTMIKKIYKVAEMAFELNIDNEDSMMCHLQPYFPFLLENDKDVQIVFSFSVLNNHESVIDDPKGTMVADFDEEGQRMQLYRDDSGEYNILMTLASEPSSRCLLSINKDFSRGVFVSVGTEQMHVYGVNSGMMMMFAFAGALRHTLLIHSSVIRKDGCGYLFLGKSGTGKSTHSSLWLKYIPDTDLLNDDNPALRYGEDGIPMVYGTPWSGKTPCYRNVKAPIGGFVSLHQAPYNKIELLQTIYAYAALLPAVSNMKWERHLCDGVNDTINSMIKSVPVFRLDCLPDEAAALMSYQTLTARK
jgi:hypothetical protein